MKPVSGQRIAFSYKGEELEGVIIQESKYDFMIKLSSGYNMTVARGELKKAKELKVKPKERRAPPSVKSKEGLPHIALLHTGGTIASRVDYETGAVIAQYTAEELLALYPELLEIADISCRLVSNIQSEMMRFAHWNILAKAVKEAVDDGVQGVIITHGTDTLHYTSAALSFALPGLPVPVLLVGSQRSSDRPSSDAVSNLLCAATFIAKSDFKGVAICMHKGVNNDDCVILPGTRCRKLHTSRRDAFKPINDSPYARIRYPSLKIEQLRAFPEALQNSFEFKPFSEKLRIGLVQIHPQFYAEEIERYEKWDGLVLSLLGIGHAPTMTTDEHNKEHKKVLAVIENLAKKIPVVGAPQTIYGRINMNVYSPGRQLISAGVLGQGCDVTPETAFVKLAWLLSHYSKKEARGLYDKNIVGECSQVSEENGFSL